MSLDLFDSDTPESSAFSPTVNTSDELKLFDPDDSNDASISFPAEKPPTPPKFKSADEAFMAWKQAPTKQHTGLLLDQLTPDIQKAVKQYAGNVDAVSMGYARGLVARSLNRYDPSKAQLNTYINRQLQPLIRWQAKRVKPVRIPERVLAESADLNRAELDLTAELGRVPSIEELADNTGMPVSRIEKLRLSNPAVLAGSMSYGSEDMEGVTSTIEDMPMRRDTSPQWASLIRSDLSDIDRVILDHTFGLMGAKKMNNAHLAKRLRMSPAAITQRKQKIQAILDKQDELSPFGG